MSPSSSSPGTSISESATAPGVRRRRLPQESGWWLGLVAVLAITVASFWLALHPDWVVWFGHWGYVGAFIVSMIASATVILPAPGIAVVIAMGNTLDPYMLGIVSGVGSAVGELSGYIAGATGRALIPEAQRSRVEWLRTLTKRYGPFILGALAALPFPLFDLAGIVAGMLRMRVINFLLAVSLGKSIKYIFLILVGASSLELLRYYLGF